MIDLSKYEKVFEWDQVYGFTMSRRPIFSTVVYLLKIGEDFFIDDTFALSELTRKHIRDLVNKIHPNGKMQEAYNRCKVCEGYILAQVGLFEHPVKIKQQFIDRFSPSLNLDRTELGPSVNLWCEDKEDSVEVKIKLPYEETKRMKELAEGHGISLEKYIQASAVAVLNGYSYRNTDLLMQEGIAIVDNSMCSPYL